MRVFLFGLSPRGINLMYLSTEPVQLVLSCLFISLLDALFMFGCICSRQGFQCILLIQIYRYIVLVPACHLAFIIPLVGEFWLSWICMFRPRSLKLVDCSSCWLEMCRESVDHRQTVWSPPFSPPCSSLEFSFCISWAYFILFIIVYLFVFSHLRLSVI